MKSKPSIAVFASGNGSNAENIIRYFQEKNTAQVALVVASRSDAGVLARAKKLGVPTLVLQKELFMQSDALLGTLQSYEIDLIVLAGFLWLVPEYLVKAYPKAIVNIHPALLPQYGGKGMYGAKVHQAVWEAKEAHTGITIHWVNEHYDEGEVIFQAAVQLLPEDDPEQIAQKVHALEHRHFPEVLARILEEKAL